MSDTGYDDMLVGIFEMYGWKSGSCRWIVEDKESLWCWLEKWKAGLVEPCHRCHKPLDVGDCRIDEYDHAYHEDCFDRLAQDAEDDRYADAELRAKERS